MDSPVGGDSPTEYGISPEGFVTGGLNHLRAILPRLRARGIVAFVDVHSLPCNSACVSDGLNCKAPLAFTPGAQVGDIATCAGGVYRTSRPRHKPSGDPISWSEVGIDNTAKLAAWIAALPADDRQTIAGLQLANEPALNSPGFNEAIQQYYAAAVPAARKHLPELPLILGFIYPNDWAIPAFLQRLESSGSGPLLLDWHWYLNWAAWDNHLMPWSEVHERACTTARNDWEGKVPGVDVLLGEWSLAINHDAPLDLDDEATRRELAQLFNEQKRIYTTSPHVLGSFYWTLRMGSGWDPRPTSAFPRGRQVEGTSASRSLPSFPFRVWSLVEMAELGVASRLDVPAPAETCADLPGKE